ncbi:Xylose operon regulatory protein [Planctomycetes bacterium Pan216]|uniref:Xylose operon regulatory protein n=1 Tax=Kolteria novifilia TaxID=2527975 RepID=A0A518B1G7_9BACT|nr:Xylose operon regulatory protein [Planctomycetes bacterium Pan216]
MGQPRVALLIESSREYGRALLAGITRFMRERSPGWISFFRDRGIHEDFPDWIQDWDGEGIIARIETPTMREVLLRQTIPVIDVRCRYPLDLPQIDTDDREVARLAVEHLVERGFRHFAFAGVKGANWSDTRERNFRQLLEERGFSCLTVPSEEPPPLVVRESYGNRVHEELVAWVRTLPHSTGILAANDLRGQQLINACRDAGLRVPREVAILGVDNDPLICDLTEPPLSSVACDAEAIGFQAAELLDRLMRGAKAPRQLRLVSPRGVVVRRSTDIFAIEDLGVARAIRLIHDHACEGINASDVVREVGESRQALTERFRRVVGHSLKDEIVRVRLERVQRLLIETDASLQTIARQTGFSSGEYMGTAFKRRYCETPGECRQRTREEGT